MKATPAHFAEMKACSMVVESSWIFYMGPSVLKRLLLTLIAIVFIGANLPLNCAGATMRQDTDAMIGRMNNSCSDCSGNAPATELAKMVCGVLACAGIQGLPTQQIVCTTDPGKCVHPSGAVYKMTGISLAPD